MSLNIKTANGLVEIGGKNSMYSFSTSINN